MPAPLSLLEELARVPDPRSRRGTRHPLPAILGLTVVAMLCGCKSYTAIAQFGRDKGFALAFALGFRRGKTPAKSRLSTLFRRLDVTAFEAALSRWVASRLGTPDGLHVCIDGKTAKGSKDGDVPGHHLVAAYAPAAQAVLAQLRVDAKTNEHKAALQLLGILPWASCPSRATSSPATPPSASATSARRSSGAAATTSWSSRTTSLRWRRT